MGDAIVFTSGKGGVGKTTAVANIGAGLSLLEKKVVMLDTDMGLRSLDVVMGLEEHIHYHLLDILEDRCRLEQALIYDKRYPGLCMISAANESDRTRLDHHRLSRLIDALKKQFDYCLIDCPAGIDDGFRFAVSSADRAVVVTTPHIAAVRDASKVMQILKRQPFLQIDLLINMQSHRLLRHRNTLTQKDIEEILDKPAIGVIPFDERIALSQNQGIPVIAYASSSSRRFRRTARACACPARWL